MPQLTDMKKEENNKSLMFGVPGLLLQIGGVEYPILSLIGTILLLIGLAFYAKAKGRHPAWCLLGLFSIFGIIGLALLKDLTKER